MDEPLHDDDDHCPFSEDHSHVPDWSTTVVDDDGGEIYVDVTCSACGRSGCVGTVKKLAEDISW